MECQIDANKANAPVPTNPAQEKASAANAFHTTWSLMSFPPAYFLPKWRRPLTALLTDSFRYSTPKVAKKANLGYII